MISDDLGDKRLGERVELKSICAVALVAFVGWLISVSSASAVSRQPGDVSVSVCAWREDAKQSFGTSKDIASTSLDDACKQQGITNEGGLSGEQSVLEQSVSEILAGSPMMVMTPFISQQEKQVAAFLVGIAKKESDWGRHAPSLDGRDCYNYWGYKGQGKRGMAMGYACFDTPEEAVRVVGGRLRELSIFGHRSTPAQMIIWKCGSSCAGHSPESVNSWIASVSMYYDKIIRS